MDPPTVTTQILNTETNPIATSSLKLTTIDRIGGISCNVCRITVSNKKDFDSHYIEHKTGTNIVYTCVICKKEIPNYTSFRGHCYNNHVLQEEIRCDKCDKVFRRQTALKMHYEAMHSLKCNHVSCKKTFSSKEELHLHQIIHQKKKLQPPFKCIHCNDPIPTLDACKSHISDHITYLYTCPICDQDITKAEAYKHINIHFNEKLSNEELIETENDVELDTGDITIESVGGIWCTYCSQLYPDKTNFDEHFSDQHPENKIMYTCNICQKNIGAYSFLVYHCYEHVSKGKFECELCDKSFSRLSLLSFHMEAFHGNGETDNKPLKCIGCNLKFAKESRLRNHLREKHDIWKLSCPEQGCDMEFQTPKELLMHQKQHKKSQKNCIKCKLMFPSLISCLKHIEIHKRFIYSCSVCSREYSEKHNLVNHISEHFETVLYMCNVCGKAYTKKSRLDAHSQTHEAVKKHICGHCGKGFGKIFLYKQHLDIHTGLKPHNCTECTKSFTSRANYKKHVARMHKFLNKDAKKTEAAKQKSQIVEIPKASHPKETSIWEEIEMVQKTYKHLDTNKGDIESGIESVCSEMDTNGYECDDLTTDKMQTNEIISDLIQNKTIEKSTENTNESYNYYATDVESGIESVSSEVENYVYIYDDQNMKPEYAQSAHVKQANQLVPEGGDMSCHADFVNMMPVLDLPSDFGAGPQVAIAAPLESFPHEYGPNFVNSDLEIANMGPVFANNIKQKFVNTGTELANAAMKFANVALKFANNANNLVSGMEFANTAPEFANTAPEFANNHTEFINIGPEFANTAPQFVNVCPEYANTAPEFTNTVTKFANTVVDLANTDAEFANLNTVFANISPILASTRPELLNTGPEFVSTVMETTASGECIPLDDDVLPHINPMLTRKCEGSFAQPQNIHDPYEENLQKWEPIITKLYQEYYGTDSNVLLNTDIF